MAGLRVARAFVLVLLAAAAGCGDAARFEVSRTPALKRSGARVSVLAIERDGLLARQGWDALSAVLSAPYAGRECPVGYSAALFERQPALASAIDAQVRMNGVTDALIARLAPAAQGDTILVIASSGRPRASSSEPVAADMSAGRFRRSPGGGAVRPGLAPAAPSQAFSGLRLEAQFYDVQSRALAGRVDMHYSGDSMEEAFSEFRMRLERELPASHCAGWSWSADIQP